MDKQKSGKLKKFIIGFSDSQKAEFLVDDLTQDELKEIVTQFYNGALMIILEESEEELGNGRLD